MTRKISRIPKNNYQNKAKPRPNASKTGNNINRKPIKTYKKYEKKFQNKLTDYFVHFYSEITTNRILTPLYRMPYSLVDEIALINNNLLSSELSTEIKRYPDKYDLWGNTDNGEIEMVETNQLISFVELVFKETRARIPEALYFILEDGLITSSNPEFDFTFLPFDCKSKKIDGIDWLNPLKKDMNQVLSNLDEIDFSIVTTIFTNIPELAHIAEDYPQIELSFDDTLDYLVTSFYTIIDSNEQDNVHIYTNDPDLREELLKDWDN